MSEKNILTEAVLEVIGGFADMRKDVEKSHAPPFMMERLRARDRAAAIEAMSPEERRAELGRVGLPEMLKAARRIQERRRG